MAEANPYDELPYRCRPIEWTAPERLALASLLHGGPRPPLEGYRLLEIGCGDGANLLPLAYYRRHASFVGLDGAGSQIAVAMQRKHALRLENLAYVHADLSAADRVLSGRFDFVVAHGVFSWVPQGPRDALLELSARRLRPGGLLYVNYNARPGWDVRGLVRDFLQAQTNGEGSLPARAGLAQAVSERLVAALTAIDHPYAQLMAREFEFVSEQHVSYVAHEYLSADNHAYWRSEFLSLAERYGFAYVADADFNYDEGRIPEDVGKRLLEEGIRGRTREDTVDLLCYRQLHSPILSNGAVVAKPPDAAELSDVIVASCLAPAAKVDGGCAMFQHPSGYQVEAKTAAVRLAFEGLHAIWPRGRRVGQLFPDLAEVVDDLRLLQRSGLIELRCVEPGDFPVQPGALNELERHYAEAATTPYHTREAFSPTSLPAA